MVCSNFHSTRVCKLCLFLFAQFIVPYPALFFDGKNEAETDGFGRENGLTKRGVSRKMGTYVRITAPECERNEDGEKRRRGFEEEKMAFSCVLHLKEECDGCGMCEEPLGRAEAWSAETER